MGARISMSDDCGRRPPHIPPVCGRPRGGTPGSTLAPPYSACVRQAGPFPNMHRACVRQVPSGPVGSTPMKRHAHGHATAYCNDGPPHTGDSYAPIPPHLPHIRRKAIHGRSMTAQRVESLWSRHHPARAAFVLIPAPVCDRRLCLCLCLCLRLRLRAASWLKSLLAEAPACVIPAAGLAKKRGGGASALGGVVFGICGELSSLTGVGRSLAHIVFRYESGLFGAFEGVVFRSECPS